MKERPILFSGAMVRAILAGTKSQTRRVVKPQPTKAAGTHRGYPLPLMANDWAWPHPRTSGATTISNRPNGPLGWEIHCPYGQPGDRLWVRETFTTKDRDGEFTYAPFYLADVTDPYGLCLTTEDGPRYVEQLRWTPSIHMPRKASRLTLEITGVRVERLQSISEADAIAEGLDFVPDGAAAHGIKGLATSWSNDPRKSYRALWESINGPGSWDANPFVWVVEFRRLGGVE